MEKEKQAHFIKIILIIFLYYILFYFLKKSFYEINNIFEYNINGKKNNLNEKIKLLKYMTNNNEFKYKGAENCLLNDPDSQFCIYHLLAPKKVVGKKRILIGKKGDGSYVLLEDFNEIKIAYSFGISNNIDFDSELSKLDIDIYMYDHTIRSLPYNNNKFHWKKIGIRGKNKRHPNLKTLEELIIENGHTQQYNMLLKLDVENAEWEALHDLSDSILIQFKYIIIEFHFENENKTQLYYEVLKKLHKNHQSFYFRCNGRSTIAIFGNNRICKYIEISYIIKKNNTFIKDDSIYPISEFDYSAPNSNTKDSEMEVNILTLFD
jgi:hypothetical protein